MLQMWAMTLWSFTDMGDPRWHWGRRFITLRQANAGPTKLGLAHRESWAAYHREKSLFLKAIEFRTGAVYPDFGCNFETFTNEEILEMESLGPLVTLAPGHATEHTEHWHLAKAPGQWSGESDLDTLILPNLGRPHGGSS